MSRIPEAEMDGSHPLVGLLFEVRQLQSSKKLVEVAVEVAWQVRGFEVIGRDEMRSCRPDSKRSWGNNRKFRNTA
jgi:hypothetical protein